MRACLPESRRSTHCDCQCTISFCRHTETLYDRGRIVEEIRDACQCVSTANAFALHGDCHVEIFKLGNGRQLCAGQPAGAE